MPQAWGHSSGVQRTRGSSGSPVPLGAVDEITLLAGDVAILVGDVAVLAGDVVAEARLTIAPFISSFGTVGTERLSWTSEDASSAEKRPAL